MSFSEAYLPALKERSSTLQKFAKLIEPKSPTELEAMALESRRLTDHYFGRTIRLFAPLYLSNECVNNCQYCGFSRDNPILRVTLDIDQAVREARHLSDQGFRSLLLVAGEHPKFVSNGYLESCLEKLKALIPTLALEVGPMETPEYSRMVQAGCEGLVVYQETYNEKAYQRYHTAGPKKDFHWRLDCPERAYEGGFRRIGLGALFGLADWHEEALGLAAHLDFLQKHCWKANYTVSFPRLRPAAGGFQPKHPFSDRDFIQLICAFRLAFPQVGIVLSTREAPELRDALIPLGITSMSAGSHTEPGGYTGAGQEDLHLTVRGRRVEIEEKKSCQSATGQFDIADERDPQTIANLIKSKGFDPVWKDWDEAILAQSA